MELEDAFALNFNQALPPGIEPVPSRLLYGESTDLEEYLEALARILEAQYDQYQSMLPEALHLRIPGIDWEFLARLAARNAIEALHDALCTDKWTGKWKDTAPYKYLDSSLGQLTAPTAIGGLLAALGVSSIVAPILAALVVALLVALGWNYSKSSLCQLLDEWLRGIAPATLIF
ncbi:MAG: hypothetical protein Q8Q00_05585 [Dehalococcoidia bacterium]|nr:hypothetical protein [Dehalococcoidia bacterium]